MGIDIDSEYIKRGVFILGWFWKNNNDDLKARRSLSRVWVWSIKRVSTEGVQSNASLSLGEVEWKNLVPLFFILFWISCPNIYTRNSFLAHTISELLLKGEVRAGEGRIDFRVGLVIRALRTRSCYRGVRVPPEPLNSTRLIRGGKTYFRRKAKEKGGKWIWFGCLLWCVNLREAKQLKVFSLYPSTFRYMSFLKGVSPYLKR